MDVTLGGDFGGTKTRLSVRHLSTCQEIGSETVPTQASNYQKGMSEIAQIARRLVGSHTLVAAGIGVAAVVKAGVIIGSGNLPGWTGYNLESDLARLLNTRVTVVNDATAAAMGEYSALPRSFTYVIWGTGVGAAIVFDTPHGPVIQATELGHMVIDSSSRVRCGCGGFGHLEAFVGGGNLSRRFNGISAANLKPSQWNSVLGTMAIGLRNIGAVIPGAPIVLGGGVIHKQQSRLPMLESLLSKISSAYPCPPLYLARHGEESGIEGAAQIAHSLATSL